MCAYMERASFGALSSFMYPLLCRFMHDLFLFLFFSLASRKNGGKKNQQNNDLSDNEDLIKKKYSKEYDIFLT